MPDGNNTCKAALVLERECLRGLPAYLRSHWNRLSQSSLIWETDRFKGGPPTQIHRNRVLLQREGSPVDNSNSELFKEKALGWLQAVSRHLALMWPTPRLTWRLIVKTKRHLCFLSTSMPGASLQEVQRQEKVPI